MSNLPFRQLFTPRIGRGVCDTRLLSPGRVPTSANANSGSLFSRLCAPIRVHLRFPWLTPIEVASMNRRLVFVIAPLLAGVLIAMSIRQPTTGAAENTERVLRHVVLFKFKPDATQDQIREIEQ